MQVIDPPPDPTPPRPSPRIRVRPAHHPTVPALIAAALSATPAPPHDPLSSLHETVPTSIERVGPGNYGRKEFEDGGEVVLLNDDVLTSVANATVVLEDGNDLERITVLYQFPQFLEHCPVDAIRYMVPRICARCPTWSPDVQVAAAEALYFVVPHEIPFDVAKLIMIAMLHMTFISGNVNVFDACGEIIPMLLPQVHRHDALEVVVPQAVHRATATDPLHRRLAARIMGSLNEALTALELDSIFLDSILALADDPDDPVRAITAQSLSSLAIKLPLSASEHMLWPKLRLMLDDIDSQVRANALRSIAKSAHAHRVAALTSPVFSDLLLPLFISESKRAARISSTDLRIVDDETYFVLEIFSEIYGLFISALSELIDRDFLWDGVLSTLRLMVTCNGPTVRHWCAYNLPAVALVCVHDMTKHLTGIIHALAGDTDLETRTTLAAGIHEVTRSLRNGELRNDIIRAIGMLFMDDNVQVRMNALRHFSELLQLLSPGEKANLEDFKSSLRSGDVTIRRLTSERYCEDVYNEDDMRRLAPIFSSLELLSFDSWRTQRLLAEEVEKSAHLIPQEMLCEHVAPLLFQMARESTFLVRRASMRALIHVLRYVPDVRRRNHIFKHFRSEWAQGKAFWTRIAFIEAAECAQRMFSTQLFTLLFKDDTLALRADPVVNVRVRLLRLCRLVLPIWKELPDFRETLELLRGDADAQVAHEAEFLLSNADTLGMRSPEESALDHEKEVAEELFYVHTRKKNREKMGIIDYGSAGDGDDGTDGRFSYDTITIYETRPVQADKPESPSSSSDGVAHGAGLPAPKVSVPKRPSSQARRSGGVEGIVADENEARKGSDTKSRTTMEKLNSKGVDAARGIAREEDPGEKPKGLFALLCGCFGGG